ncbi:GntR family transcriptional regulator [Nocardioides albertanoniae]|uniref:GntR family transcriptional regulator n=1 Tax=Nocardioides albertanoniae TaxID=1175486 RepID=A0A543A5V6_9ACTN|nr:FCD domain-containing protein [Nocardioides albertanoniae]TQL67975.1 GntR family transcriptional regulator [Nocardioides albertanoniae]
MPLQSVAPASLVEQAIAGLRGMLESGEWPVGHKIPPEPTLAEQLGVSRNTVREAVRALAHAGVLVVRRGDGTYVAAPSEVAALVERQLGLVEQRHVFEVRMAFEVRAAGLAAARRTPADLDRLTASLRRRAEAVAAADEAGFVDADAEFHSSVVAAAGNPLMSQLYDGFQTELRSALSFPDAGHDHLTEDHHALFDAIRAQDVERAVATAELLLHHAAS